MKVPRNTVHLYPNIYLNVIQIKFYASNMCLMMSDSKNCFWNIYSSVAAALNFRKDIMSGRLCCMETGNIQLKHYKFKCSIFPHYDCK